MKVPVRGATPGKPHLWRTHIEAEGENSISIQNRAGVYSLIQKKASFIMEIISNTKFPHPILKSPDRAINNW